MQKTSATQKKQKALPSSKGSGNPTPQIGEAGVLTSAGIEKGHTQSDIPKSRRKNFASLGSE